jgi:hypothetical protein
MLRNSCVCLSEDESIHGGHGVDLVCESFLTEEGPGKSKESE